MKMYHLLSSESLKIIESVLDERLNDYDYLKDRICQYVRLTEQGQRDRFRNLQSKSTQTFLDFSTEVQLVLENWLKTAKVGNEFQKLKELVIKDRIQTAVPSKMPNFLMERREGYLKILKVNELHAMMPTRIFLLAVYSQS